MKQLTSALEVLALVLVITGGFVISIGVGLITTGLTLAAASVAIDRMAERRQVGAGS